MFEVYSEKSSSPRLVLGADDSNHANGLQSEVVLLMFSTVPADAVQTEFPNRKDYLKAMKWLNNYRDFRFAVLGEKEIRTSNHNLATVVPFLLDSFFQTTPNLPQFMSINLAIDGNIAPAHRADLLEHLQGYSQVADIASFTKKQKDAFGNMHKRPNCPPVLYFADVWACMLGCQDPKERRRDPRYVELPARALKERYEYLKASKHSPRAYHM